MKRESFLICMFQFRKRLSYKKSVMKNMIIIVFLTIIYGTIKAQNTFPPAGNVGIGTTSPNATLDVKRGTASWGTAVFRGTNRTSHFNYHEDENTYIRGGKPNSNIFLNDNGGNVSIRHTNPGATLDVARGTASWGTAVFRGTERYTHFNYHNDEHTYIRGGKVNSNVLLNDNGGNVGIRNSSPSATLDVSRGDANGGTAIFRGTDRATYFNHSEAEHIYIRGGKVGSNVFLNDNGGNVGIRNSSPIATLDVSRGDANGGTAIFRGTDRATYFNHSGAEHIYIRGGKVGSNVFLNDNGGNVGIRNSSPSATLDVSRGDANGGTAIFRGTDRATYFNHSGAEHIYIRGGKVDSNVFLNDNGGNVGIRNSSPSATLDVSRGDANGGTAIFRGTDRATYFNHSGAEHIYIRGGKVGSNVFLNDNGGNVSIRHANPSATLDVARGNANGGTAIFRGTNRATHFNHSTDEHTFIRGGKENSNVYINDNGGNVAIGTTKTGSHKLAVEGSIGARKIIVEVSGWSDFVFEEGYDLPTLSEVERHIKEKGHLKDIPSSDEATGKGIDLGAMDAKLLQKIEELTLYIIDQEKKMKVLEQQAKEIKALKAENKALMSLTKELLSLKARIEKLEE